MEKELVSVLKAPELKALDNSKADKIIATFEPMAKMLKTFESKCNEVFDESENGVTKELSLKAKRIRLDIGKVRIETGKLKDKQKEYIKLEDRAIMGVHNILVWSVKEKEDRLKEIENHFEIQEKKCLEALQSERAEKLSQYVEDAHERNLSGMEEDVWEAYFQSKKQEHEERLEAEHKAEADRIEAERIERLHQERKTRLLPFWDYVPEAFKSLNMGQSTEMEFNSIFEDCKKAKLENDKKIEKQRLENERLKKEAEERERKAKAGAEKRAKEEKERQAKEEAERKEREEKERKEREAHEAQLKAEREAREKVEREERAKREKLETELRAKAEAERKAKEEEEARRQAELRKTDANKVEDLVSDLKALKSKYVFKSEKGKKMYAEVSGLLDKTIQHIVK